MSSHREAPEISKDPVADSDGPLRVRQPGQARHTSRSSPTTCRCRAPPRGPNFFEFGDDVLYQINISTPRRRPRRRHLQVPLHDRRAQPGDLPLQHRSDHVARQTRTSTGARPTRSPHRRAAARRLLPREPPAVPAVQHRTALDAELRRASPTQAVHSLPGGGKVFAGQRADGFYVDLGSVFDLLDLRPFQNLHLIPTDTAPGVNASATSTCTASRCRCRSRS